MAKALVLLSGGLDSMLAAKVLMEQGVEVVGLSFKSYFFGAAKGEKAAERLGVKHVEVDFSDEHLAMVKNPAHGYGKNMNPCIDCHGLMLKKAKEIMEGKISLAPFTKGGKCEFDVVATGEVLGQRPMSQNAEALKIVEKIAGLPGRLLRPMSAKLLEPTEAEKTGKINRGRLLDISGRSRARQLELVKKFNIKEFASPGGGCLLTDPAFSEKLLKLLEYWPAAKGNDIELLKNGRVFWLKNQAGEYILLVVGRDQKDNERLADLAETGDAIIELAEENGPTSLVRSIKYQVSSIIEKEIPEDLKMSELKFGEGKSDEEILVIAMKLTGYYASKARGKKMKFNLLNK